MYERDEKRAFILRQGHEPHEFPKKLVRPQRQHKMTSNKYKTKPCTELKVGDDAAVSRQSASLGVAFQT